MNRQKFHDVACQGNLKFCQGIVREMSGNFVSAGVWQPCFSVGKSENSGIFSETIAASDLKVSRSSHLIEYMIVCEYWRSRSFLDLGQRS